MKKLFSLFLVVFSLATYAQENSKTYKYNNKGKLYFYWGWNNSAYSQSDIYFYGKNFEFTLKDAVATDRQTPVLLEYINPKTITIPQYNLRIGYFINDKYSVSIGNDHMKYVVKTGQQKTVRGHISETNTKYDGYYDDQEVEVSLEFMIFEHTDGLNYENIDIRRHERFNQFGKFTLDGFAGIGIGLLYPRTNATLFQGTRYDKFNVAGYGYNALAGLNLTYKGRYFVQTEYKGGYIDMPNIRISEDSSEGASQSFYFFQYNIVFGFTINIGAE